MVALIYIYISCMDTAYVNPPPKIAGYEVSGDPPFLAAPKKMVNVFLGAKFFVELSDHF